MNLDHIIYTQCAKCDHFIEINDDDNDFPMLPVASYIHLDDGEKEHDHDAEPGSFSATLALWKHYRPDLFEADPTTGKIGPNRFTKAPGGSAP